MVKAAKSININLWLGPALVKICNRKLSPIRLTRIIIYWITLLAAKLTRRK
jgi:hypothetical protein